VGAVKTSQRIAQSAVARIEPGVADQTIEDGYDGWMRRYGAFISTEGGSLGPPGSLVLTKMQGQRLTSTCEEGHYLTTECLTRRTVGEAMG